MLRRLVIAAFPLVLLATAPAVAEEKAPNKQVGQYVDLQPVALPIVVDGQLVNYVFVSVRLNLASGVDTSRWRAKEPFFRDALVRAAARQSLAQADFVHVDEARLKAAVLRDAAAIIGPGVVINVRIIKQQPQKPFVRPAD